MTYEEMAKRARPEAAAELAAALLLIFEADRCPGITNGEALLCPAYAAQARRALLEAGVIELER